MAIVRFPEVQLDNAETHPSHVYQHFIIADIDFRTFEECRGIAVDPRTNYIFVVFEKPPSVSVLTETGEFLTTFSNPYLKSPWGIAIYRDNIYMTDTWEHSVFHFRFQEEKFMGKKFQYLNRSAGKGSRVGLFKQPRQLTVSLEGDIFVADRFNHRIQVLNARLQYQRHISHSSMKQPRNVNLTSKEVFVLCIDSPYIHVFTLAGEKSRSFATCGNIGTPLSNPISFCFDADENLVITDALAHYVRIFSHKGTLLYTIGNYFDSGVLYLSPEAIAFTSNLKLVIVFRNYYTRFLVVFSL